MKRQREHDHDQAGCRRPGPAPPPAGEVALDKTIHLLAKRAREHDQEDDPSRKRPCPDPPRALYSAAPSLSAAWFLLRCLRVTASKLAEAVGLSKYASHWAFLWQRIFDPEHSLEDNEVLRHGRTHEPTCIGRFRAATGNAVLESPPCRAHWRYPFLLATPDGFIERDVLNGGRAALVEAKAPYYCQFECPPPNYVPQMFLQMATHQIDTNYLVAWFHTTDYTRVWRVGWSDAFFAWLLTRVYRFMLFVSHRVLLRPADIRAVPYEAKEWFCELQNADSSIYKGSLLQQIETERAVRRRIARERADDLPPRFPVAMIYSHEHSPVCETDHASPLNYDSPSDCESPSCYESPPSSPGGACLEDYSTEAPS